MKISKKYGPQYDNTDGTIGNLQLVKRYVITGKDGFMIYPSQGRYTYETKLEAETLKESILTNNSTEKLETYCKGGLFVECFWCYPNHFDPIGKVPNK